MVKLNNEMEATSDAATVPSKAENQLNMDNYYFTFGYNHTTKDGYPLEDHWVRVVADSYDTARELFITSFAIPYLLRPTAWSMQYEQYDFHPAYFHKGELMVIE